MTRTLHMMWPALTVFFGLLACAPPATASLMAAVVTHDGIAIAADSRLSRVTEVGDYKVVSDDQVKLVIVRGHFLVGMGGKSRLGKAPLWKLVADIGEKLSDDAGVDALADKLAASLSETYNKEAKDKDKDKDKEPTVTLMVAGCQYDSRKGKLIEVTIPAGKTRELHTTDGPGMAWSGDGGVALDRLVFGVDKRVLEDKRWKEDDTKFLREYEFVFPLGDLSLNDAGRLAGLMIRTAIDWSEFIQGTVKEPELFHPTVGGPVDIAVVGCLTPGGSAHWIQRKDGDLPQDVRHK